MSGVSLCVVILTKKNFNGLLCMKFNHFYNFLSSIIAIWQPFIVLYRLKPLCQWFVFVFISFTFTFYFSFTYICYFCNVCVHFFFFFGIYCFVYLLFSVYLYFKCDVGQQNWIYIVHNKQYGIHWYFNNCKIRRKTFVRTYLPLTTIVHILILSRYTHK